MSDTDLDRSERERQYAERGKRLLEEFEGRKASISEQDRKEACVRLGLPYIDKPMSVGEKKHELEQVKRDLVKLKEKLGLIKKPQTFVEAIQPPPIEMLKEDLQSLKEKVEGKKSTKKETLPSPPSEIILPSN